MHMFVYGSYTHASLKCSIITHQGTFTILDSFLVLAFPCSDVTITNMSHMMMSYNIVSISRWLVSENSYWIDFKECFNHPRVLKDPSQPPPFSIPSK